VQEWDITRRPYLPVILIGQQIFLPSGLIANRFIWLFKNLRQATNDFDAFRQDSRREFVPIDRRHQLNFHRAVLAVAMLKASA
jgi:hypothetical protein